MADDEAVQIADDQFPLWTLDPECPTALKDMLHVYHRPKAAGETLGMRMARRMMDKDPFKFAHQLARLECDFLDVLDRRSKAIRAREAEAAEKAEREKREAADRRAERKAGREADAPAMDRGSAACLALAEKLLADRPWEGGA